MPMKSLPYRRHDHVGRMQIANTNEPDTLLSQKHLANRWGCSERTLQRWRTTAAGPTFIRLGGNVRYRLADVIAFEDSNRMLEAEK